MPLLARSRRRSDTAEALDRARELSTEALDRASEVADRARGAAEPRIDRAREAVEPRLDRAREAVEPRLDRAREAAEPRIARAREVAEPRIDRAREASRPVLAQVGRGVGSLLRLLVRVVALLPGFGARVLETIARLLGSLADRSAEIAHVEPPSRAGRRRSRRRAALWFTGGFAVGAAAGYAVNELTHGDHDHDEPWQSAPPTAVPDAAATAASRADG